ncbi:MAG: hypothetical protein DWP97_14335 [Calditrichaeota bacterium]|nr:MAG: hypothetical protein DWP97_14335 [Calditrichota bacterium]
MLKYISLTILLLSVSISAQDAGQESPFSIGAGARALGMGGGFTSLSSDASSIYYNPAGLPTLSYQQVSLMHVNLFEGVSYNYAGWVYPDSKLGGFGLGYFRIGTDDIIRSSNFAESGTFDYSNSQFVLAYGKNLKGGFSIGLSFKIVNQTLDSLSDYGFGLDLGMTAKLHKYVRAGVIFRDVIPPELELAATAETIPVTLSGGIALDSYPLFKDAVVNSSFEIEKIENRDMKVHTGLEMILSERYAVRTGYDRDNLSFGAGVVINNLSFDYAYKVMDYIDDSHRFTLSFNIGSSVEERLAREEQLIEERGSELVEEERTSQFEFYRDRAENYHRRYMLDSASVYYQRALAFDENNSEIIGIIAGIQNSIKIRQETEKRNDQLQTEIHLARVTFLAQAQNFYEKKHYDAALDMLQLILDVSPNYNEALYLKRKVENSLENDLTGALTKAQQAEKDGDNLTALTSYNKVLELDAENKIAHEALARIAANMNIAQQLNTGIQLYNSGKEKRAKQTFEAVLTIDRNNPIAIEYLKKLDLTTAKQTTLEDLQQNKDIWKLYLDGLRYMRNKEYQKAVDAWNKVLKVYPNNINTLNNLEQALLRLESEKSE